LGLLIGLGLHSVIEAIALAASLQAASLSEGMSLASVGIFLAIALHKPLDAMSIASVMTVSRWSRQEKFWVNLLYAGLGPIAAIVAFFGFGWLPADTTVALGFALAFSGGTFLCISLGDLLPELHFHSHDRLKLSACLLAGVLLVIILEMLPIWQRAS
jgi:zinc and cadmium transporter